MEELIGKVVEIRETTGYVIEGVLLGVRGGLIPKYVLDKARQITWVDETNHENNESWDLPSPVYIAEHCVSMLHPTHLKDRV